MSKADDAGASGSGDASDAATLDLDLVVPSRIVVALGSDVSVPAMISSRRSAVALSLKGLPSGLSATASSVAPFHTAGGIVLAATAAAVPGVFTATAVAEAGDQHAERALTIEVYAKPCVDASFGDGGVATFRAGRGALGVGVRGDGGLLVPVGLAGVRTTTLEVYAFEAAGALDTTYGNGGKFAVDFAGLGYPTLIGVATPFVTALDGSATFAITGYKSETASDIIVVHVLPNGAVDPAFGTGGLTVFDLQAVDEALGVRLDDQGRYVVVGTGDPVDQGTPSRQLAVARLLANGRPDPTFGTQGLFTSTWDRPATVPYPVDFAVDGETTLLVGSTLDFGAPHGSAGFVTKTSAAGAQDASYGASGTYLQAEGLGRGAVDSTGRLYVETDSYTLGRLTGVGGLDPTWGTAGTSPIESGETASRCFASTLLPTSARLLRARTCSPSSDPNAPFIDLFGYTAAGSVDLHYASAGGLRLPIGSTSSNAPAAVVAPDGKVVVIASQTRLDSSQTFFEMTRVYP